MARQSRKTRCVVHSAVLGEGGAGVGGEGFDAAGVEGDLDAVGADGSPSSLSATYWLDTRRSFPSQLGEDTMREADTPKTIRWILYIGSGALLRLPEGIRDISTLPRSVSKVGEDIGQCLRVENSVKPSALLSAFISRIQSCMRVANMVLTSSMSSGMATDALDTTLRQSSQERLQLRYKLQQKQMEMDQFVGEVRGMINVTSRLCNFVDSKIQNA